MCFKTKKQNLPAFLNKYSTFSKIFEENSILNPIASSARKLKAES